MERIFVIFFAILLLSAMPASAQDFEKGLSAHKRGDYATALKEFTPLAEQGNVTAQFNLGVMYANGQGVQQDYNKAIEWFHKSAEKNHPESQFSLGTMYLEGKGVPQDYEKAAKWFRMAAEQGLAEAQNNLAARYEKGQGVLQDYSEAVKWYRKAAGQGYALAQYNIGLMYSNGLGVQQNYSEATKWWSKAAEQGHVYAQYNLGVSYAIGRGVLHDNIVAHVWLNISARNGNSKAVENRDKVSNVLSSKDLSIAHMLARNCLASNYSDCPGLQIAETPNIAPAQSSENPAQTPSAVNQEPGLVWNKTGRARVAPLLLKTTAGQDYFVKLVDSKTGQEAVAIYVVGGRTIEVDVPLGSYHIKYAYGKEWKGENNLFGPGNETRFARTETRVRTPKIFNFRKTSDGVIGYTVELILQRGGNLETRGIDRSQF